VTFFKGFSQQSRYRSGLSWHQWPILVSVLNFVHRNISLLLFYINNVLLSLSLAGSVVLFT